MGTIVDLTGRPVKTSAYRLKPKEASSADIQEILDHVSWLNQEGMCSGLVVAVMHHDGQKTKAYALDERMDVDSVTGFLERIKEMLRKDLLPK